MAETDQALLEAWRDGEAEAGDQLLRRHFPAVYRFFRSKFEGPVDDLIQATFLGCVEGLEQFRGDSSFRGYLLGIARRKLMRLFRDKSRGNKVFDLSRGSALDLARDAGRSPSGEVAVHDEQKLVLAALRSIPLDFQITIELHYWEELTVKEIAQVLEVEPGTVKSRLSRARARLKARLEELAGEDKARPATLEQLERWTQSLGQALEASASES